MIIEVESWRRCNQGSVSACNSQRALAACCASYCCSCCKGRRRAHRTIARRAASTAWLASCAPLSSAVGSPTASGGVSSMAPGAPDLLTRARGSSNSRTWQQQRRKQQQQRRRVVAAADAEATEAGLSMRVRSLPPRRRRPRCCAARVRGGVSPPHARAPECRAHATKLPVGAVGRGQLQRLA